MSDELALHERALERAILSIRRRLQARASPATRNSLIGATAIRAELQALGIHPLPPARTIERVPATQRRGTPGPRRGRSSGWPSAITLICAAATRASCGSRTLTPHAPRLVRPNAYAISST
jgi:hypothetical protein